MEKKYLKLYGITKEEVSKLRPMSSLKFSEINKICSIIIDKDITCGRIDWVDERDFVCATFSKEEDITGKFDFVTMGITINDEFKINYVWEYHHAKGIASDPQQLYNSHKVTAWLISENFDVFNLNKLG